MRWAAALGLIAVSTSVALADDRKDIPDAIYDQINAEIVRQTTFLQLGNEKPVRWAPHAIDLVTFVKAPSPTYANTYLYAMRYRVVISSDTATLDVHGTICQAVVVVVSGTWDDKPTVVCEPVDLSRADQPS